MPLSGVFRYNDGSSDFPGASTTGVPDGTSLTTHSGNLDSSSNGQIIEAFDVSGTIVVTHTGVTVRKCLTRNILIDTGATNSTVEDCDVVGGDGNTGITFLAGPFTLQRCDISGTENGIWVEATNFLVQENYIHNLDTSGVDPHTDGLQVPNGSGVGSGEIRHNNFQLHIGSSSTMTMSDAANVLIINNRFNGGTYILYFGLGASCTVTNNRFGEFTFGYVLEEGGTAQTYSGNVVDSTGAPLSLP